MSPLKVPQALQYVRLPGIQSCSQYRGREELPVDACIIKDLPVLLFDTVQSSNDEIVDLRRNGHFVEGLAQPPDPFLRLDYPVFHQVLQ